MGLTEGSVIALGLFVAGLIYHAGQLAQRVTHMELWRAEIRADVIDIKRGIEETQRMIRAGQ